MSMIEKATAAAFANAEAVRRSAHALNYHIAAPSGWINDPNGLVRFDGRYHVFYQHYPYAPQWGPMHWGHASSADLAHWRHEPVALAPDQPYEKGCFSGSAVDDSGVMTLIYTAHDDDDPIKEKQCIARSCDGVTFTKSALNPVIPAYPEACCSDFRDPKVWKQDGRWHLVAGSSHNGRGCAVLYSSDDLEHWEYRGIMCESDGTLGSMWECPSFFRTDEYDVLIVSPMQMSGHKNIAIFGQFDCSLGRMTIDHWQEIDHGEDFYAAQIMEDGERTILFAWMDMWGKSFPTAEDGWAGALTMPRVLSVRNGRLVQLPPPEMKLLRGDHLIHSADACALSTLSGNSLELVIDLSESNADFRLSAGNEPLLQITLYGGEVAFAVAGGKTFMASVTTDTPALHIFIDRSSVECFVNGGDQCFTQRIYPNGKALQYALSGSVRAVDAWTMANAWEE